MQDKNQHYLACVELQAEQSPPLKGFQDTLFMYVIGLAKHQCALGYRGVVQLMSRY
jgi:hypothetical protein